MPVGVETVIVQYPGRHDRISEPCIEDMHEMADIADALTPEVAGMTDLPMTMFGHGIGSAVAYEVASRLERDFGFVVDTVFVSARSAPHCCRGEDSHRRLRAPFVAFGGEDDPTCSVADLYTWSDATSANAEVHIFPGGHDYLATNEAGVAAAVARQLSGLPVRPTPRPDLAMESRPPSTSTEQSVIAIWAAHLGMSGVGADDDFFSLGGHSLAGMKILDEIRRSYQVEIAPVDFYLQPTPAALAAKIDLHVGGVT
jgi:pyochelin biosynthetic protein PchC